MVKRNKTDNGRIPQLKTARHAKIIEIINKYNIETQEELADKLNEAGFQVTQATVSRDIRELKLMKISEKKTKNIENFRMNIFYILQRFLKKTEI